MTTAIAIGRRYQVTVILDPDQIAEIDRLAEQQRTSRAAVLRVAVDAYLATRPAPAGQPAGEPRE